MTAIGGMLYQDVPEQLCNAYLKDNQALTGAFLIIVAVAAAVGWCIYRFPALNAPARPTPPPSENKPENKLESKPCSTKN